MRAKVSAPIHGNAKGREEAHGYHDRTVLNRLDLRGATDLAALFPRPATDNDVTAVVRDIIDDVRARGDAVLRDLTERFDGCRIDDLRVPRAALDDALQRAEPAFRAALAYAAAEIRAYHELQVQPAPHRERAGLDLEEITRPVDRAGLYVPGGRASYPSTVLMTAIPAQVAGVPEIVLCVPPGPDGLVPDATLAAASLVGVDEVYRVGGAQAIAALAYGTETIRPVDVVVGPGNAYVAAAKREVSGVVGIDSLAGPSEVVVVADASAPAEFAAADLLAQAEHGPGGTAILVTWDVDVADAVDAALVELVAESARGADVEATLVGGGRTLIVSGPEQAMDVVNVIAPEHLELIIDNAEALVPLVRNAGAVFVGPWAPAAVGDYVAGVNHVLPTARTARFASALRVDTFRKHIHVVRVSPEGLGAVAEHVEALATAEGLPAHGQSVALRRAAAFVEDAR
jgi:histidinol dehydrogenase